MEQAEREMNEISEEQRNSIRKYLLGSLDDKVKMRQIEEKILLDDGFTEQLSIAEDVLVEEYLDGRLTEPEREGFLRFFLVSTENKEKLRLIGNLRKYATNRAAVQAVERPTKKIGWFDWRKLYSSPAARFAAIVLLLFGAGFGIWRVVFYESNLDQGLAQLRLAYRGERPTESRTSADFDYAPISATRGENSTVASDEKARRRAELLLSTAVDNSSDARTHHALGLLYLTDGKFDEALSGFKLALKIEPDNAKFHSDLGAALAEKARRAETSGKFDEALKDYSLAHESVNRALEIDGSLLEALFNKALILQRMRIPHQARAAWEEYLKNDSASPWASEARLNLELLQQQGDSSKDRSQILRDFLGAHQRREEARAWEVASQTKEPVAGVMIGQQLALMFLEADGQNRAGEAVEALSAFAFLGRLESHYAKDRFFDELADYYSRTSVSERVRLRRAQAEMKVGYEMLLKADWHGSLESFQTAKEIFSEAGDGWEAGIAEYQVCYCLCQLKRIKESNERLAKLSKSSAEQGHRWLQSLADGWIGNNYSILGEHSKAVHYAQKSLEISTEISDTHNFQKTSNHLTHEYLLLGNSPKALASIYNSLNFPNLYYSGRRQKSRNLLIAARALYSFRHYDAAAAFGIEQLRLAEVELKDVWLTHTARMQLALIYSKARKHEAARREIEESFRLAGSFPGEAMRQAQTTETSLTLAHLQKEAGDCANAVGTYSRVIEEYDKTDFSIYKYEARKGRLLCAAALNDDAGVGQEMSVLLKMFDENRRIINEEADRNIFFDNEQGVYDIAAGYAYTRWRDAERAFDYAEHSRARSLLDLIKTEASPLTLREIRRGMPSDVRMIYYAVLSDRLLIWQISASGFTAAEKSIGAGELQELVEKYMELLLEKKDSRTAAKELYKVLIAPLLDTLKPGETLCVIPDKHLLRIPFAALVSPQTDKYLIEDHPLIYAPSATVFVNKTAVAERKNGAGRNESVLSVGNPSFSRGEYPELADLPDAKREAEIVAAMYDSAKVFTGGEAVKNRIADHLEHADILHFATHYVPNASSPALSKLLLTSGEMTVEDMMQKHLPRARLIILSACETGVESFYRGEGMIGAARAFLTSDAPLIVASQWSVDSEATAELMINFHHNRRRKGMTTIAGLRQAQIDLLAGGDARLNRPYYWAAFLPIGGYALY